MYIQGLLTPKFVRLQTAMRTGEMGQPDELKSLASNSCEEADPSTPMIGCQFWLLVAETELVPWVGQLLNECTLVSADPYAGGMALLNPQLLASIGHIQTSTMDTAKVLSECFPVLKGIGMWAAAIQPNPGAEKPHLGMNYPNMAMSWLLICEPHPTALCEEIVILGGGSPSACLRFLCSGCSSRRMYHPWINLARCCLSPRSRELSGEQLGHWDEVPVCYPQWGVWAHVLIICGWMVSVNGLPPSAIAGVSLHLSIRCWIPVSGCKAVSWQSQGV